MGPWSVANPGPHLQATKVKPRGAEKLVTEAGESQYGLEFRFPDS